MQLTADLTHLPLETRKRIREVLAREDEAQIALAKVEQAKIAQLYRSAVAPGTTKDGFGPVSLAIHPYFVSYFRRKYGDRIFQDKDFTEYLKRKGEWFHVPETGTRVQVGYTGPKRFSKKYSL